MLEVIGILWLTFLLSIWLVWLHAERAYWKREAAIMRRQWLDAEDRAFRAEVVWVQRERHRGIVYEAALDNVQHHPRQSDYDWSMN